jgi:hypothetical protein
MNKLISSIVIAVALSLVTVSGAQAQDTGAKADVPKASSGVRFYTVEGLDGIFFSNGEAYAAAQNAGMTVIKVKPVTIIKAAK